MDTFLKKDNYDGFSCNDLFKIIKIQSELLVQYNCYCIFHLIKA